MATLFSLYVLIKKKIVKGLLIIYVLFSYFNKRTDGRKFKMPL